MAKLSTIRDNFIRFINSSIWLQRFAIQDPLIPNVVINNVEYPPNVFTELPVNGLDIAIADKASLQTDETGVIYTCTVGLIYKLVHIFYRERYPTIRSLPYRQVEDLLLKTNGFVLGTYKGINQEIVSINVLRNGTTIDIRVAENINSTPAELKAWAIVSTLGYSVKFLISLDDFTQSDFNQIQPATWTPIDSQQPIPLPESFELKELEFVINQSKLPEVKPQDPTTYTERVRLTIETNE